LLFAGLAGYAIFSILQLPLILSSRWWVYVFLEVPRDMVKMALPGIANLQTVLSLVASSVAVASNVGFFAALYALSRRIMRGAYPSLKTEVPYAGLRPCNWPPVS